MKLHLLSETAQTALLLEANVFNAKEDYSGTSIAKFAEFYGNMLSSEPVKQAFVKKISRLLMNDERYHHALRDVPADAPEWAKTASASGELVYFQPDEELKGKMEHMTHWLNALEHDAKQNQDPNAKANANKELQGFPKAESIELLDQKSNEYFARGSKKVKGDVSGMKPQLDAGNGYVWYVLEDPEAFQREGKVLQNCIGSHYTAGKCQAMGYKIYILKNPQGESVVAVRTQETNKTIEELKGKQNKPPVEKYMPYVKKFIVKSKFALSNYAQHDLKNAGYFFIDNEVYTKTEAIKKFTTPKHIDNLGYGLELVSIDVGKHPELLSAYTGTSTPYYGGEVRTDKDVYELRKDGHPILSAIVHNNTLERLMPHSANYEEQVKESIILEAAGATGSRDANEFIQALFDRNLISRVSDTVKTSAFWRSGIDIDHHSHTVTPRSKLHDKVELKDGGQYKKWEKYTGTSAIDKVMRNISATPGSYNDRATNAEALLSKMGGAENMKAVYVSSSSSDPTDSHHVVVAVDKDNNGHPYEIDLSSDWHKDRVQTSRPHEFARIHTINLSNSYNKNIVTGVVELAKHHGFELPDEFRITHGVRKTESGKPQIQEPKGTEVGTDVKGVKYDLSNLNAEDKLTTLYSVLYGSTHTTEESPFRNKRGDDGDYKIARDSSRYHHVHGMMPVHAKRIISDGFKDPDAVYVTKLKYGSDKGHNAFLIVKNNKVTALDDATDRHKWQHWGDEKKVIDQLNKFATEQGLKFNTSAVRGAEEFRVDKDTGLLHTATDSIHKTVQRQIEKGRYGKEGTDEIKFADESSLVRATPEENAKLLRAMPFGSRGEIWKFMSRDGKNPANILVSKNVVKGMYTPKWDTLLDHDRNYLKGADIDRAKANAMSDIVPTLMGHVKTAAEKFGWDVQIKKAKYERTSDEGRFLENLATETGPISRNNAYVGAGIEKRGQRMGFAYRWDNPKAFDKELYDLGLIRITEKPRSNSSGTWMIELTPKGRRAAQEFARSGHLNLIKHVADSVGTHPDWEPPTKKEAEKKQPTAKGDKEDKSDKETTTRAPRATPVEGGGSKADQALKWFKDQVEANGSAPSRKDFINRMKEDPFNMSDAGASTYWHNTKKKYDAQQSVTEALRQSLAGLSRLILG